MVFPVRGGEITTGFDEMRPLSVPRKKRTHPHGALDIAAPVGNAIRSPEPGTAHYFCAIRQSLKRSITELDLLSPFDMRGHHYFYDTYGAIIIVIGDSGYTHVFAHSYLNQLFNRAPEQVKWKYEESAEEERWPVMAWHTFEDPVTVQGGEVIGYVGNAGYSTGPHVHWEIHHGTKRNDHKDRVRATQILPEAGR